MGAKKVQNIKKNKQSRNKDNFLMSPIVDDNNNFNLL